MRKTVVLLFILCTCCLSAQTAAVTTLLSVNEGLSQGMVFDVLESRDGFIWIATKDGLNRYDGYGFEIFSPDPFDPFSVANSEVHTLFEDGEGRLWCGYNGGLDVFVPETNRFFHLPMPGEKFLDGYDLSFAETPDGAMWVAGKGHLWKIEAVARTLQEADAAQMAFPRFLLSEVDRPSHGAGNGQPGMKVQFNSVFYDDNQALLVGTSNGLYRIDLATGKPGPTPKALPGVNLFMVGMDRSGRYWVRSEGWLWGWEGQGLSPKKAPMPAPGSWRLSSTGHLWNLTGSILHQWVPDVLVAGGNPARSLDLAPGSQSQAYYLTDFEIDRSGNVWVGTSGYGLLKVVPALPKFISYLPLTSHRMFVEDPSGRLFSTAYPLTIYAGKQFDRPQPNPWFARLSLEKSPGPVLFDPKGNCWVMLEGGTLCRVDAGTKEPRFYHGGGIGIFYTQEGRLLSVSEEALIEFDPATEQFRKYPFEKPLPFKYNSAYWLNYFFEDREGILWMNAHRGLVKGTPTANGYRFEHFFNDPADRSSLSNDIVLSVAEDPLEPGRYLWAGTKGGGLNRLDRQTGKFTHFKTEEGLPDNVVYGILTDNTPLEGGLGRGLWLSTNKGLCRMTVQKTSPDDQASYRFNNFTAADGLQSNEFNQGSFLKMRDGTMVFGGVNGVTVFHPDSLRFNERRPVMALTRLWVNNQPLGLHLPQEPSGKRLRWQRAGDVLRLEMPHHQNLVSVEFAALEFTNPSQNQYRYQLHRHGPFDNGENGAWVEMGSKKSVQFANLRPGRYTFKALGSNNDGTWSDTPAVLEMVIHPPWWATWWAYLLYVLAASVGVLVVYRYQLRRKLEYQETLRLRELDEFKNRFFTNITHEFRTPLTVILGMTSLPPAPSEGGGGVTSPPPSEGAGGRLALIRRNAESLLRLINQILDLAKLESKSLKINYVQGDVLPYLRYIVESLHSLANVQNVMLRVESDQAQIVMDYDPERLLQIVHNLLSNAIKFTPSGGRVVLRAGLLNLQGLVNLELKVTDSGTGIPPEDLPHVFERFFQAGNSKSGGGSGIGLSLTKELVKAMGGEISASSELGKGAVFTVRLPVTNQAERTSLDTTWKLVESFSPAQPANTSRLPSPASAEAYHLLVIEDNPDVVEYLAACLGSEYHLDVAYNGREGIEKALETIPDIIISDVMMPEKDGFEVVETLKNDERTSHVPIVLLTAKASVESRIAGLRRGADAYLSKPFHREELTVVLANLLELRRKLQAKYASISDIGYRIADSAAPQSEIVNPLSFPKGTEIEDAFLQKVRSIVEQNLPDADFEMPHLERALAMSRSQIFRKMKALTGKSPSQFIRSIRLHHGRRMLQTTELTVSEIAYDVGFANVKYFSDAFLEEFGERPTGARG